MGEYELKNGFFSNDDSREACFGDFHTKKGGENCMDKYGVFLEENAKPPPLIPSDQTTILYEGLHCCGNDNSGTRISHHAVVNRVHFSFPSYNRKKKIYAKLEKGSDPKSKGKERNDAFIQCLQCHGPFRLLLSFEDFATLHLNINLEDKKIEVKLVKHERTGPSSLFYETVPIEQDKFTFGRDWITANLKDLECTLKRVFLIGNSVENTLKDLQQRSLWRKLSKNHFEIEIKANNVQIRNLSRCLPIFVTVEADVTWICKSDYVWIQHNRVLKKFTKADFESPSS